MAGLLAAGVLAAALVVPRPAPVPAAPSAHAAWLRAQVAQEETDAAFEQAVEAAVAERARTLRGFLWAFVAAHPAPDALGAVFAREGLSGEALVRDLQGRLLGLSGVPPQGRPAWTSAVLHAPSASGRTLGAGGVAVAARAAWAAGPAVAASLVQAVRAVCPVRLLSAARPLGP